MQVYKDSNQVIPVKLRGMIFYNFYKDNIDKNSKSNEATKHFHGTSIFAFQTMKSVDDGAGHSRRYMVWTDIENLSKWESHLDGKFSVSWNYC